MQNKNRIEWIDVAKGYGIIGVIIGHITTPYITVWIYTFHIPLFFFLSGYLFRPKCGFVEFCKRKLKTLLVPYLFLSIPVVLNEYWFHYGSSGDWIIFLNEACKVLVQERYTPLWFISSLFLSNIIFYWVYKTIKTQQMRLICAFLFLMLCYAYWKLGGIPLPWNLDITMFIMPFMALANYIHQANKFKAYVNRKSLLFLFVFLLGNIIIGWENYHLVGKKVDLFYESVDILILTLVAALCGISFIIMLSRRKTIGILNYLGRNSLLIFAWHLIVYNWLGLVYDTLGLFQTSASFNMICVRDFISLVVILLVLIPVNELILKSRLKFILGR